MPEPITLSVNGTRRSVATDPDRPLLEVLREDLDLTGTRYGCGEGQCGACTVLLDGKPVRSCITPISAAAGKRVTTIEGLARGDRLHAVQEAFLAENSFQCGYCTSGMIMSAAALLEKTPHPTEDQIVKAMQGNVCRCGTYRRIIAAVQRAAGAGASGK